MRKVILDMDPGVDDALALILALRSPEIKVEAITTVSGNVNIEKTTRNALRILEFVDEKIPVARGMANPLVRDPIDASHIHGKDGLGGVSLAEPGLKPDKRHVIDLLLEVLGSAKRKEYTLIATGPLTNIAATLTRDPEPLMRGVSELVVMGGAYGLTPYGIGNQTAVAEFNMFFDPEAAKIVFDSGLDIVAVGLDVVMDPKAIIQPKVYHRLVRLKTRTASLFHSMTQRLFSRFHRIELPDPMSVAYVVKPSLFKLRHSHVEVETAGRLTRGQTVVDRRQRIQSSEKRPANANVAVRVSGQGFLRLFINRVVSK